MNLTDKDIRTIKDEKQMGIILPSILLVLGCLFNFNCLLTPGETNWAWLILFDIGLICLSILISRLMNLKYNRDLKEGIRLTRIEIVQRKEDLSSNETGSGAMRVPLLRKLFPKIWRQQTKPVHSLNLIVNNNTYHVGKETFDLIEEGDYITMHYTMHSFILLKIEAMRNEKNGEVIQEGKVYVTND